jgi:predicted phage terminase large subunit-like protein
MTKHLQQQLDDLDAVIAVRRRLLAVEQARDSMVGFMRAMMPDRDDPDDIQKTEYKTTAQGLILCDLITKIRNGEKRRVAVSIPPQHGKTIHLSTYGPAWIWGSNPTARIVVATYNEDRAAELGDDFLTVVNHPAFKQIFPEFELSKSSKSKTAMRTTLGGKLFFVGQGSGTTGKTADYFIIDDPIKDDIVVQSDKFRNDLWKWFFSVAYSRGSNSTRMIVLHTRWHEDDLIGRLCDPNHPERNGDFAGIAEDWEYLNLPGVIKSPALVARLNEVLPDDQKLALSEQTNARVIEQFGHEPMCALYAADKDLEFFSQWKRGDKRSFGALVMGEPTPDDGVYFMADWIKEYDPPDLPKNLRFYGASDHAVSAKTNRDFTIVGSVGVDETGGIWVMPDLAWARMETPQTVEELLAAFRRRRHDVWWMEDELISKSFGPFLYERMRQESLYQVIVPVRPAADKQTRARAIQGRMALGTVHFPRFTSWWQDARAQVLRFPYGANDDFVDFLSHIGNGLSTIVSADGTVEQDGNVIRVGSLEWIMRQTRRKAMQEQREVANDGW